MKKWSLFAVLMLVVSITHAQDEKSRIHFRLNTEMHNTSTFAYAVNQKRNLLLTTARYTPTAKLWNIDTGALLQTYYLPMNDLGAGIFGASFAKNDKWIALSSAEGGARQSVSFINIEDAKLMKKLEFEGVITSLCSSPDGSRVAVGGTMGVVVWNTKDWSTLMSAEADSRETTSTCLFTQQNELITVATDRNIRLFAQDGELKGKIPLENRIMPYRIALHPDEEVFALGTTDKSAQVILGTLSPFEFTRSISPDNIKGMLMAVDWSADGKTLYAAGKYQNKAGSYPVLKWSDGGEGSMVTLSGGEGNILNVFSLPNNRVLSGHKPLGWMVQNDQGEILIHRERESLDAEHMGCDALQTNADGQRVYVGSHTVDSTTSIMIDLDKKIVESMLSPPKSVHSAKTNGLSITEWKNATPKLNNQKLDSMGKNPSRCMAIDSNNNGFVLSTKEGLRRYAADGSLVWEKPVDGGLYAVNLSEDNRFVLGISGDGVIHWYHYTGGDEVLSLFVNKLTKEWIAWTPDGYFDASENGASLIGWLVAQDKGLPEFHTADSLRTTFHDPESIKSVFDHTQYAKPLRTSVVEHLINVKE